MFTKHAVTIAALLIFGGSSIAVAIEDPENRIADRYPTLEKIDRSAAKPTVGARRVMVHRNVKLDLFTNEDVENKIADRYPFLEQPATSTATAAIATRRAAVQRNAKLDLFTNEDIENKIADRYPFLEQTVAVASRPARSVMRTTRSAQRASVRQATRSVY